MGVDQTFYVGPMVKCEPYEAEYPHTRVVCPKGCKSSEGKFCHSCGSERAPIETIEKGFGPDEWDVHELLCESLYRADVDGPFVYWVPNEKWEGDLDLRVGKYEAMDPFEITGKTIEENLEAFKKRFANRLKILDEEYRGKTEVIWAAASWCW